MNSNQNSDDGTDIVTADDLDEGDRVSIAYDSPQSETPVEKTGEVVKTWTTGYELVADSDDEDRRIKVVHSDRLLDGKGRARVTSKLRRDEVSIQGDEWTHGTELGRLERSSVEGDDEPVTVREEETVEGYELPDEPEEEQVETDGGRELRGTYDRLNYDAREDGFDDGDRVTVVYESPYSGTEVEVEGDARDVSATSFTLELDDGREWGVLGESIRTTENSRRASGKVDAKNGRTVGYVRELRVYAVEDEEEPAVRADGGQDLPTHDSVEDYAEDVDLSDLSDDALDALDARLTELLNADPYEFPTDTALSAAFRLSSAVGDEQEARDPRRDDPYFHPEDTEERFSLPITRVEVYEQGDEVRARFTLDESDLDDDRRTSSEWRIRPGTQIAEAVLHYYGNDDLRELGTVVGLSLPVVGSERFPWGRVDRYALESGEPALDVDEDPDPSSPSDSPSSPENRDADARTDGGAVVEEATDEEVRIAVEVEEGERLAAESERARELDSEQRNATPADLYPDGGEEREDDPTDRDEFEEGDRVHVVAQPLNRHADPSEVRGTVEENTENSLLFDTGANRYRLTAGGSLYRVPTEDEDPRGFEELLGTADALYRVVEEVEA